MKHVSPMKPVSANHTPTHSPTPSIFNKAQTGPQAKEYSHLQEASIQVATSNLLLVVLYNCCMNDSFAVQPSLCEW